MSGICLSFFCSNKKQKLLFNTFKHIGHLSILDFHRTSPKHLSFPQEVFVARLFMRAEVKVTEMIALKLSRFESCFSKTVSVSALISTRLALNAFLILKSMCFNSPNFSQRIRSRVLLIESSF